MPDYQKGQIYKLVSNHTDNIYIGSTTQPLRKRLGGHISSYKKWGVKMGCTSFELLKFGDTKIILIEKYPCNDKDELTSRERHHIENTPNVVNIQLTMTRTKSVYKYNHSEKRYINISKYRSTEKGKEAMKRQAHSDARKAYLQQTYECECGSKIRKSNLAQHRRTKNHIDIMQKHNTP